MNPDYTFHMYENDSIFRDSIGIKSKYVSEIINVNLLKKSKDKDVKNIKDYLLRFSPILSKKSIDDTVDFVIIKKENLIPLTTFFLNKHPLDIVSHIISSFTYLLDSFEILNNHNIINVNYTSIAYRENSTPVLFDFVVEKSIPPYYLPIELFLLNCFLKDEKPTLSIQNIEEICLRYERITGTKIERKRLHDSVKFFSHVVNKPRSETIRILTQYKSQWHIFGLASVFIQLISILDIDILPKFISEVLFQCVSLLPNERLTSQEIYNKWCTNRKI